MKEYTLNSRTYIDLRDVRKEYPSFFKGVRSTSQLIARKGFKDYVFGRLGVDENELIQTEKLSKKFGSVFVNKDELSELFETKKETLPQAPPLITDDDLVFFRDDEGNEFKVPMRGERKPEDIFFQVKGVMEVFQMGNLSKVLAYDHTSYKQRLDYTYFNVSNGNRVSSMQKEMYLTYDGLIKVIETSRSGVGHKFKKWIKEVVFSAMFGTVDQKIETFKKVLNVDADHLKSIMSKCPTNLSCLYLIDIKQPTDVGKRVFKYGFTGDVRRRFNEHMKTFGDNIVLDTFILIPELDLSKAENDFKGCVSRYKHLLGSNAELIALCDEGYINIQNIFKSISRNYCGNVQTQIAIYEQQINDLMHKHQLEIIKKDSEIIQIQSKLELALKDNELLQLKLTIAEMKASS